MRFAGSRYPKIRPTTVQIHLEGRALRLVSITPSLEIAGSKRRPLPATYGGRHVTSTSLRAHPELLTTDLDERVADALLAAAPRPDDVAALVTEVEAEFGRVDANRTAVHSTALDPTTPARLIPRARGDIFELDFKADRLSRALTELRAKHEAARVQVEEARRRAELATVTNERDALAAEINDRYPVLAGEIADLLARVRGNDARATALGLDRSGVRRPWDPEQRLPRHEPRPLAGRDGAAASAGPSRGHAGRAAVAG